MDRELPDKFKFKTMMRKLQRTRFPHFRDQETFEGRGCQIDDVDIHHFFAQAKKPGLKYLWLTSNRINDGSMKILSECQMVNIQYIELGDNRMSSESCRFIMRANWPKLKSIKLGLNFLGDRGIQLLVKNNWRSLEQLSLPYCKINRQIILIANGHWKKVKVLDIYQNGNVCWWMSFNLMCTLFTNLQQLYDLYLTGDALAQQFASSFYAKNILKPFTGDRQFVIRDQ